MTAASRAEDDGSSLWWVARNGIEETTVKLLESHKADLNSEDENGWTPLQLAAHNGHQTVVELLLKAGADPNLGAGRRKPLKLAAYCGHEAVVMLLLNCDTIVADSKGADNTTPLYWAARRGHESIVKLLLDSNKVDAIIEDKDGMTPLYWAAWKGHDGITKLLLEHNKNNSCSKPRCDKTIWEAAKKGHTAVVKRLLDTGILDPNSRARDNKTPLWWAVKMEHEAVVGLLLNANAIDINLADTESQRTPLSLAVRNGHRGILKRLLDCGKADLGFEDLYGVPPLLWAIQSREQAIFEWLRDDSKIQLDLGINTSAEIDRRCLARWLEVCDNRHNGCCPDTHVENEQLRHGPQWVIDTEKACIVPGQKVSRYVALSYVWNSGQENGEAPEDEMLLLNETNLPEFRVAQYLRGPAAKSVPLVIKDTMELVRRIGVRYMWVDRLCIVQDGHDKQTQIEHMDDVYTGAYLTVIAATSSGLFGAPRNKRKPKNIDDKESWFYNGKADYFNRLYHSLMKTKWATRGWTFQEHILSRRAVIFVDGDMFWDCQRSLWDKDELLPGIKADTYDPPSRPYYEMARHMSTILWPDFAMYVEMVSLYNGRDLTYPQDALPAISGVFNLFSRSFPSGFVSGLPRLFLDIALLWQPFSKATRRHAKTKDKMALKGHLPSWSWCGWHCLVDPFSLRTGLAYLDREDCQSRASTWRTRRLVQWSVLSDRMQLEQRVHDPRVLEVYEEFRTKKDAVLPQGWIRHADGLSTTSNKNDGVYFTHASDTTTRFKHPVPINDTSSSISSQQNNWPFLSCETGRVFFTVGAVLKPAGERNMEAALKISVFNLPQFTEGPASEDLCDVISLEDDYGRSAGTLRCMDDTRVVPGQRIELVAISSGSASFADLNSSYEESIDRNQCFHYRDGLRIIRFKRVALETKAKEGTKSTASLSKEKSDSSKECLFYNVLWIERKGEIAYRRAAGRVPKAIWEGSCPETTKNILG